MGKWVCSGLENVGMDCGQIVVQLTVWHMMIVMLFIIFALVAIRIYYYVMVPSGTRHIDGVTHAAIGAAPYDKTLMLNAHRMWKALEQSEPTEGLPGTARALKQLYHNERTTYFVVEFREAGKFLFRRELAVRPTQKNLGEEEFRVDSNTLEKLKAKSRSSADDDTGSSIAAIGDFDINVRPVGRLDWRHYLNHPNREIRLTIWVALFAITLEYSIPFVRLIREIFSTPSV